MHAVYHQILQICKHTSQLSQYEVKCYCLMLRQASLDRCHQRLRYLCPEGWRCWLLPCCSPGQGAGSWHCSRCQGRTEDCRTLCLCPNVSVSGSAHCPLLGAFTLYYTIFSHRFLAHLMLVPRRKTGFPTRIDSFKIRSIINYFNFKV